MPHIVFEPWVGERYWVSTPRLLIVGESHYGEPIPIPALATHKVVEHWRSRLWAVRYLLAAARLIQGQPAWQIDRAIALEQIAFYNYVQFLMPNVKVRPTHAQVVQSEPAFREVLAQLNPTHIIVTGQTVWQGMPHFDIEGISGSLQKLAGEELETGHYRTPSGMALAARIPHLSRYFSPKRWHPPVRAFLEL